MRWADALLIARLLAAGGSSLGGVRLRSGAGPVRDRWLECLQQMAGKSRPVIRVPASVAPSRLTGGIDIAASLRAGQRVEETGILGRAEGGMVILAMAERTERGVAAILAQELDRSRERGQCGFCLIALDEAERGDAAMSAALADRLDITLDLNGIAFGETLVPDAAPAAEPEHGALPATAARAEIPQALLVALAEAITGIPGASMRKFQAAVRLARMIADLEGRKEAIAPDCAAAIRLCFGAVGTGEMQETDEEESHQDDSQSSGDADIPESSAADQKPGEDRDEQMDEREQFRDGEVPDEMMVAAANASRAVSALLARADNGRASALARTGKSGAVRSGSRRGRPAGLVNRPPHAEARPDVVATLRAAIPWQKIRNPEAQAGWQAGTALRILPTDFRYVRFRHRTESTAIFAVDASGSTAISRLSEAKGAIELLLGDCYVRRDNVALVAFRGFAAETLLEPTRSLVRAKRSLTGLPGGGATPLAGGIMRSLELASMVRRRGQSPLIVYLSDGRGNIALDGTANRERAAEEANSLARQCGAMGFRSIFIDIAQRPRETARELASAMNADYWPLPHVNASLITSIVSRTMKGG
ncbi:MAG: VWA domain-containing protein [Nitratireductor sp.]|nr:VWA domain-containing protein [Nitratireductor sp.]